MAKYIEEQEILWRMNNALDEQDTYLPIHFKEMVIDECNTSDVVERSEYEYLKKENRELAIKYDNAMNMVINEQENVTRLCSKINKAIEELENLKVYDRTRTARLVSLPEVFEILKKNIGE